MSEPNVSYASVDDVATTLGREIPEGPEKEQVEAWISKVERRISRRLGDLKELDEEALKDVISEVVARRVRNPDGKRTERIDDYSYSLDVDAARSGLFITEEEWELLTPNINLGAAFSITSTGGPWIGPGASAALPPQFGGYA